MAQRVPTKRSEARLRRLVDNAVARVCETESRGLWFSAERVLPEGGRVPSRLVVYGSLHFLGGGAPHCCGEPACELALFPPVLAKIEEHVRRSMGVRHPVTVEFRNRLGVAVHDGAKFRYPASSNED